MPIDVTTLESPGWWIQSLANKLRADRKRLDDLDNRFRGNPPLPVGAQNAPAAVQAFRRKAHTNLARLIVQAVRQRQKPTGFRTAAEDDENGDKIAWSRWKSTGMTVRFSEIARSMGVYGRGYAIVGLSSSNEPIITAEDARQVITEHDPVTDVVIAALKLFHDPVLSRDFAYLYLPGQLWVASREVKKTTPGAVRFAPGSWDWDESRSADLPAGLEDVVPVIRFENEDGLGEFEPHLADLDRISDMIYHRMTIALMQAFKQRAIKGELPSVYPDGHPQAGEEIDYDGLFVADPGALWMIPGAAEIWESGQADLTGVLAAVKDDIRMLSASAQTPLAMFNPESANQTAEGAARADADFAFKIEDRRDRSDLGLVDLMALMFRMLGDETRSRREDIEVLWAPVERHSLQERADAASKAKGVLPRRAILTEVYQFPPHLVDRYMEEMDEEMEKEASNTSLSMSSLSAFGPQPPADVDAA